ncbi:MAG: AAA family ATPase [Magnetococcales bacterium]|nr:AAA family ATPase [Magnetococcales bacterium]MBF0322675.1 AAA family ATPase [Magnetococcales bacterium]
MITVIGNLKGGCGKSTMAFNLAVWLASKGRAVVAFDLDPQATLSDVVEVRQDEGVKPDIRVFRPESDPTKVFKQHGDGEIIVDVGASNLWAMRQAIGLADRVVIPVPPSQADVWSTQRFLNIIQEVVQSRDARIQTKENKTKTKKKPASPTVLVFVNRADTHPGLRESEETAEALSALEGVVLLEHRICQRTSYRRSFSEGRAVFELPGDAKSAQEFYRLAEALYPLESSQIREKVKKPKEAKIHA